jgi:hypothetical protein
MRSIRWFSVLVLLLTVPVFADYVPIGLADDVTVFDLNNSGVAAGAKNGEAMRYNGSVTVHGPGVFRSVNGSGVAAGRHNGDAVIFNGSFTVIGEGEAFGVNDSGDVLHQNNGRSYLNGNDIGGLGPDGAQGVGLSNNGHITGTSAPIGFSNHAFLKHGATMVDLTPTALYAEGRGVNDSGNVAGVRAMAVGDSGSAFAYIGGVMYDLSDPGDTYSASNTINNLNVVGGKSQLSDGTERGWIWTIAGGRQWVDDLIEPDPGYYYTEVFALNDANQLLVKQAPLPSMSLLSFASLSSESATVGLLSIPEPASLGLLTLGLSLLLRRR